MVEVEAITITQAARRTSDDQWVTLVDELLGVVFDVVETIVARIVQLRTYSDAGYKSAELLPEIEHNVTVMLKALRSRSIGWAETFFTDWISTGEHRAERGVSVSDVLYANVYTTQAIYAKAREVASTRPDKDSILLDMLELLSDWEGVAIGYIVDTHLHVELEVARRERDRRLNFVRGALSGSLSPADLHSGSKLYGLNPSSSYHAVRAKLEPTTSIRDVRRAFRLVDSSTQSTGILEIVDDDACGFVARLPPRGTLQSPAGASGPVPLHQLPDAFREATRAMETAVAMGLSDTYDLASLRLHPAVVADHEIGDNLLHQHVTPLKRLGESGEVILETVERYLANDRRLAVTATELCVHINTVRYRIARFEELTGASLRRTESLVEVWWALRRSRIN